MVLKIIITLFLMLLGTTKASAQIVGESEPNNTKDMAQLIQATKETAIQAATGSRTDQYVVMGSTSMKDIDWYKVYLSKGTQYVNCNDNDFNFWVYDEMDNNILYQSYTKAPFGSRVYPFEAYYSGYYYIKVQGTNSVSQNYKLGVGDHTYALAHCKIKFGSIKMSNKKDYVQEFNLSENNDIPKGTLVYEMVLNGVLSTRATGAIIDNISQSSKMSLVPPIYKLSNISNKGLDLKSHWKITIGYKKDSTINLELFLYFVYPVTSEFLPSDEIIINI